MTSFWRSECEFTFSRLRLTEQASCTEVAVRVVDRGVVSGHNKQADTARACATPGIRLRIAKTQEILAMRRGTCLQQRISESLCAGANAASTQWRWA